MAQYSEKFWYAAYFLMVFCFTNPYFSLIKILLHQFLTSDHCNSEVPVFWPQNFHKVSVIVFLSNTFQLFQYFYRLFNISIMLPQGESTIFNKEKAAKNWYAKMLKPISYFIFTYKIIIWLLLGKKPNLTNNPSIQLLFTSVI